MLDEIYVWLESYCGASYDFDDALRELSETNACIDPFAWMISIDTIMDQLNEACDVVDQYKTAIPVGLPSAKKIKQTLAENMLTNIVQSVKTVFGQLNIDPPEIQTTDQLRETVYAMYEFLMMLISNTINDIIENNLYEDHEEEDDHTFENILGIMKQDVSSIAMTVNEIREAYYDSLDTEDQEE